MYPLEENPTLAQIIVRSVLCHPSLLAETLEGQAAEDRRFAATRPEISHKSILSHAKTCAEAARGVRGEWDAFNAASAVDWDIIPLSIRIVAANVAARLQCLPRHVVTQAAILEDEKV